jgi:hypothetical protein
VLVDGRLAVWVSRTRQQILSFLPDAEPDRGMVGRAAADALAALALEGEGRQGGLLVAEINGEPASQHVLSAWLVEAGFVLTASGYQRPREATPPASQAAERRTPPRWRGAVSSPFRPVPPE